MCDMISSPLKVISFLLCSFELEHFFFFFLFFQLSVLVTNASMSLLPVFGSFGISFGQLNNTLEGVNSGSHSGVQLCLDGVQVIVDVLSEADQESQWLLDTSAEMLVLRQLCKR